jgi:hypothetical protein
MFTTIRPRGWFKPRFVIGLCNDIERDRVDVVHEIPDAKIGAARVSCDGWIAKKIKIAFRGGEAQTRLRLGDDPACREPKRRLPGDSLR